ncbi:hypothetical protein [uncultured Oscillibacter sp.]|uniref:hypothetical protein n=1 Tax=uncultured Oscillibacter sp. TaxID=876091 RepID=UPI0025FF6EF8|nr:hypothetical protein [uncultured Oscillibacter sp.]
MGFERFKPVRDHACRWLDQMSTYLEDARSSGDMRKAYVACAQLAGGLAFASSLYLVSPLTLKYWEGYITARSLELEPLALIPDGETS